MQLENFLGYVELERTRLALQGVDPFEGILRWLNVTVTCEGVEHIPAEGPCVVVANHPHGILDGAVLRHTLFQRRTDVKILANRELTAAPELADGLIPVDLANAARNPAAVRAALSHVASGGALVLFPAGTVAPDGRDDEWQAAAGRLIQLAARRVSSLRVVPVAISGRNSRLFQLAAGISRRISKLLLLRELWNKRGALIELRAGAGIDACRILEESAPAAYLRWRVDLLGSRQGFRAHTSRPLRRPRDGQEPFAPAGDAEVLSAEIRNLEAVAVNGELAAYMAPAFRIPATLREIGRLREVTFRQAGEGTGKSLDLDEFDSSYLHLFLWNREKKEIAGAYRLRPVTPGETEPRHLYTSTLFQYDAAFLGSLGHALELGRSFVAAPYQRSFSALLLLWKAIGAWVAAHPKHATLFGPVSISSGYSPLARRAIYSFLRQSAWLNRPVFGRRQPAWELDKVLPRDAAELDEAVGGIPVLLRQYLKLGGKLIGFHIDRKFANVLDGLIVVDLRQTERKLLDRYLTREGAEKVLSA